MYKDIRLANNDVLKLFSGLTRFTIRLTHLVSALSVYDTHPFPIDGAYLNFNTLQKKPNYETLYAILYDMQNALKSQRIKHVRASIFSAKTAHISDLAFYKISLILNTVKNL